MTPDLRTFRAPSPHEALEKVKQALGPEAVILGTRSVKPSGVAGLTGKMWTEITAAPGDTATPVRSRRAPQRDVPPVADAKPAPEPGVPEAYYPYYVRLVQNEVAEELAQQLITDVQSRLGSEMDEAAVRNAVCEYIGRLMSKDNSVELKSGELRRMAFIGPSGCGKTTTVAKLAARYRLHCDLRVGLLSLDPHRLGAHEQLGRYAEIIDVPLRVAQTISEVKSCLRQLNDVDVLLIDTPGVGLREDGRFARLATLLRAARADASYLVLPASTSSPILKRMAEGFAPFAPRALVLTHLDDVIGFGVILNIVERLHLGISYWSTGQNIPDDLEEACSERLAELLFSSSP